MLRLGGPHVRGQSGSWIQAQGMQWECFIQYWVSCFCSGLTSAIATYVCTCIGTNFPVNPKNEPCELDPVSSDNVCDVATQEKPCFEPHSHLIPQFNEGVGFLVVSFGCTIRAVVYWEAPIPWTLYYLILFLENYEVRLLVRSLCYTWRNWGSRKFFSQIDVSGRQES